MNESPVGPIRKTFYLIIIVASFFLIYLFGFREMRFFRVPSSSMQPTLRPNDLLLTLEESTYARGDIVVFMDPVDPEAYLVKRVVGIPGDTVAIESGGLILNGHYASEPYTSEPMRYSLTPPVRVGEGELFVLGDNRNASDDSHAWGKGIPYDSVVGKVRLIYLPLRRSQFVHGYPLINAAGN